MKTGSIYVPSHENDKINTLFFLIIYDVCFVIYNYIAIELKMRLFSTIRGVLFF